MLTEHILAKRGRAQLTEAERALIESAISDVRDVPARATLFHGGEPLSVSAFVIEGFMARFIDDRRGIRQLVAIQVPGDFIDLHAYPLTALDHDVGTITAARIGIIPHSEVDRIITADPTLGKKLWFSTLLDAAQHRQWIFRLGRLSAQGRVAHFFCETFTRLKAIGRTRDLSFHLPLTQADISDVCGLTSVHVNRVLKQLRDLELCHVSGRDVTILDFVQLAKLGNFDPSYLYLDHPYSVAVDERGRVGANQ